MVTCPVCEHQQALSDECEVCGKPLSTPKVPDLPAVHLAELESTRIAPPAAPELPVALLPELELTRLKSGPDLPEVPVPGLDLARAPAVDVPSEALPELERHLLEQDPAGRTPVPSGPLVCRYCHHTQSEGLVCNHCGMRLLKYVPSAEDAAR